MTARTTIEDRMSPAPPVNPALLDWAEYWYPIASKCLLIAGAITAIGVCVTVAFFILQWRASSIREMQTEWRRSMLERDVADVRKMASEELSNYTALRGEVTEEQAKVETLDTETAGLALKNLYISNAIQPRHLSNGQMHDLIGAWKAYSGRSVIIWSYETDLEGGELSEQIKDCLIGAQVVVVNDIGRLTASMPSHVGIQIAGVDKRLVGALHAGLHEIGGLEATEIKVPDGEGVDPVPAEIFVGMKPLALRN